MQAEELRFELLIPTSLTLVTLDLLPLHPL